VLLALAIGALVAAPSANLVAALLLVVVGSVLGWLYLEQERTARAPVIPIETWTARGPVGSSLLACMFVTGAYLGSAVFVPLYLQQGRGQSAVQAGFVVMTGGAMWTVGSFIGSQGPVFWQKIWMILGAAAIAVGGLAVAAIAAFDLPVVMMYFAWGGAACGMGIAILHLTNWAVLFSPIEQAGSVSGAVQIIRLLGSAAGAAIMGALLHLIGADPGHLRTSIVAIFLFMACLALWPATLGRPRGIDRADPLR